jgi:ABC-2 type transport system ATP-binding protein
MGRVSMIEVKNLTKEYRGTRAVDAINLSIDRGDAFGFIGPNGAGKTTTIKMMATLIPPTEGEIIINGLSVAEDPDLVKEIIGYMPDHYGVYEGMKVWEYLDFFAAAFRKSKQVRRGLIGDVMELTDLTGKSETPIEVLSTGMKQRLCLAKTLLHDPKVLLLDEPAAGLDPRARIELKALLKELTSMGKTIFISSHILPELADYCNKIGIIERGRMVAQGAVHSIIDMTAPVRSFKLKVLDNINSAVQMLKNEQLIEAVELVNGHIRFNFKGESCEICDLIERIIANKVKMMGFWEEETNLEDVFMKITKGELA